MSPERERAEIQAQVDKRNAKIIQQVLIDQNKKIAELESKLSGAIQQLNVVHNELNQIKAQRIKDLVSTYSSGPTVKN